MADTKAKIVDAFAEWNNRDGAFCVYLVRESQDIDDAEPMQAVHEVAGFGPETVEGRIYKAAFVACPKDIGRQEVVRGGFLGFEKEAQAKRVAKAVKAELKRIEKGELGPTDLAIQIACEFSKPKAKGSRR